MVLAVVMALVPRRVRVTSVALYNFIITNISGLSTTLVPLLRARFDTTHTFRFFAEPLAGAATGATAAAAAAAAATTAAVTAAVTTAATATSTAAAFANANATDIVYAAADAAVAASGNPSGSGSDSDSSLDWSGPVSGLMMLPSSSAVSTTQADGLGAAAAGGKDAVEFIVEAHGSRGLQMAMLWMYPGMYLASSGEMSYEL